MSVLFKKLDWSALAVAVKNGHEDIVNYLVKHDADTSYVKRVKRLCVYS